MPYIIVIVFYATALISAGLIMLGAEYQDKDYEKSVKKVHAGLLVAIFDLLSLAIVLIILLFV